MQALPERVAVITGAASGIGRALALQAAEEGMQLALADINAAGLDALERELRGRGRNVISALADVRDREAMDHFADQVFGAFSSVALVFANAGIMRAGSFWQLSAADWEQSVNINIMGAVHTAAAFLPGLQQQGEPARIVFTGSTSSFLPRPHLAAYSCTKHALWGLAEALALELREIESNVQVSLLAPAGVKTGIAAASTGPGNDKQTTIQELLEAFGMPAQQLAEVAFAVLKEGRFWILPQPDFKPALEQRVAALVAEHDPGK